LGDRLGNSSVDLDLNLANPSKAFIFSIEHVVVFGKNVELTVYVFKIAVFCMEPLISNCKKSVCDQITRHTLLISFEDKIPYF
jgi:hypothetical protein